MKTPLIVPISINDINYSELLRTIKEHTTRSPTHLLDLSNKRYGDLAKYLSVLGYFGDNCTPNEAIKEQPYLLKHIHLTFLIEILNDEQYQQWSRENNLIYTDNLLSSDRKKFGIVSGNLYDWRQMIIDCSNKPNFVLRYIANGICLYIEHIGLDIFPGKKQLPDETFNLR